MLITRAGAVMGSRPMNAMQTLSLILFADTFLALVSAGVAQLAIHVGIF